MGNKYLFLFLILILFQSSALRVRAGEAVAAESARGRIFLQVEANGEAWYVNPLDIKRHYLGRPDDAFIIMRKLGIGITDNDLMKIRVGVIDQGISDSDSDGLEDNLEIALGSDQYNRDSDGDGYGDRDEIMAGYDPTGAGGTGADDIFSEKHQGKIFLQVQRNGEAWYVNPSDLRRYYLGRPSDAFAVMRKLGVGISDDNLGKILLAGPVNDPIARPNLPIQIAEKEAIYQAGEAIMKKDAAAAQSLFVPEMEALLNYVFTNMDSGQCFDLGNIIMGSKLVGSTENERIYANKAYFALGGYDLPLKFIVRKQADGKWLVANL